MPTQLIKLTDKEVIFLKACLTYIQDIPCYAPMVDGTEVDGGCEIDPMMEVCDVQFRMHQIMALDNKLKLPRSYQIKQNLKK